MQCKFCGTENEDGAVYCANCGKRVDGTQSENLASNLKKKAAAVSEPLTGYKNVLDIAKTSLILAAFAMLLVFSFFVGIKLTIAAELVGNSKAVSVETTSSFDYLITQFQSIADAVKLAKAGEAELYSEFYAGAYMPAVLTALVIGANIVICIVFGVIAAVKFVKRLNGERVNLAKYIILPVVTTLASYAMVFAGAADAAVAGCKLGLNRASFANVITVAVLLGVAAVLHFIIDGKKTLEDNKLFKYFALGAAGRMRRRRSDEIWFRYFNRIDRKRRRSYAVFDIYDDLRHGRKAD